MGIAAGVFGGRSSVFASRPCMFCLQECPAYQRAGLVAASSTRAVASTCGRNHGGATWPPRAHVAIYGSEGRFSLHLRLRITPTRDVANGTFTGVFRPTLYARSDDVFRGIRWDTDTKTRLHRVPRPEGLPLVYNMLNFTTAWVVFNRTFSLLLRTSTEYYTSHATQTKQNPRQHRKISKETESPLQLHKMFVSDSRSALAHRLLRRRVVANASFSADNSNDT